ncbi:Uma2 family endonuclease [Limnothrix sp. FACHB-881]|uniref:Uma2 family endonuclease n=1 Tax=unclassified Limnothrix TaxID=2632864 RepID=UPI001680BBDE|nr:MULTISPECIES: Uma2 family endonuclease [unclassified Limnothrix]MBD2193414.1 Uma2 family endonuclease [Limnothrix sp. FACHB-1088]MBD2636990.1 Uma2 family endonuclease [Limnothrix sp. FACHB-881]
MLTLAQWTVAEYHQMIAAGLLVDRRVELLNGQIIEMSPEGPEHTYRGETLAEWLRDRLRGRAYVREARPITLDHSEPEPDIAVVRGDRSQFVQRHPGAADLFWVIEIARSTLTTDLTHKRDLYARVGIPEYWVVDLVNRRVVVFRQPEAGRYSQEETVSDRPIAPLAFPDCAIDLAQLFQP